MWTIDSMSRAPRRSSQVLLPKGRMNFLTTRDKRAPPTPLRIVLRRVDHFRRGGLDGDVALTVARGGADCLLGCRLERAILLSSLAHALDRLHDTVLLRHDSISEIRCPTDVLTQAFQNFRDHYHCLDACVPRLFRSRVGQCL